MRKPLIITKIQLERTAKRAGCCRDFRLRILKAKNRAELLDIYIKGVRWSVHHDYPSIPFTLRNFKPEEYNSRGVYISENIEGKEPQHKALIALGNCTGDLHYGDFLVRRLVAKHNAKFDITVNDYAILMVDVLDNAKVTINVSNHARVVAYYYGDAKPPEGVVSGDAASIKIQHRPILKNN